MAQTYPDFELPKWVLSTKGHYSVSLAGSAAAPLSLSEVTSMSTDPATTRANLQLHDLSLGLGNYGGDTQLRATIAAELYATDHVPVQADDIIIANATTGANLLVLHALLQPGDHAICLYPCYGQLTQYPAALPGVSISYWRLDATQNWSLDLAELERLLAATKPKLLILNNPHNPTGTLLPTATQAEIVRLCAAHGTIILCDEIFRPLFHDPSSSDPAPRSFLEHAEYDKIIVTGSLSKPWGLSGVRLGWVATRSAALRELLSSMWQWMLMSASVPDEVIGREVLHARCRLPLLQRTLGRAQENLALLAGVMEGSRASGLKLEGRMPAGGGTAFLRVVDGEGEPVDDVAFCHALREKEGVLLAPGSLTFGGVADGDFRGYVRIHITAPPDMFRQGIEGLRRLLEAGESTQE